MNASIFGYPRGSLEAQSLTLLNNQFIADVTRSSIACMGVITNLLIIAVFVKEKSLHTKFMFNVVMQAFVDLIYCVFVFVRTTYFLVGTLSNSPRVTTPEACMAWFSWVCMMPDTTRMAYFIMCMERVYAIGLPLKYNAKLSARYCIAVNVIIWLPLGLGIEELVQSIGKQNQIPLCTYPYAVSWFIINVWQAYISNIITYVNIAVCLISIVQLLIRLRQARKMHENMADVNKRLETKAILAVTIQCIMFVLTRALGTQGGTLVNVLGIPSEKEAQYLAMFTSFGILDSAIKLFVYLAVLKLFRRSFVNLFCKSKTTVVTPAGSAPS